MKVFILLAALIAACCAALSPLGIGGIPYTPSNMLLQQPMGSPWQGLGGFGVPNTYLPQVQPQWWSYYYGQQVVPSLYPSGVSGVPTIPSRYPWTPSWTPSWTPYSYQTSFPLWTGIGQVQIPQNWNPAINV